MTTYITPFCEFEVETKNKLSAKVQHLLTALTSSLFEEGLTLKKIVIEERTCPVCKRSFNG
jgi:hypothetical protein